MPIHAKRERWPPPLAGLFPAAIFGVRHTGTGLKSSLESLFSEPEESAFYDLEKTPKTTIYSTVYDWLLCARRNAAFMAQLA
jgi:hypothetical protein